MQHSPNSRHQIRSINQYSPFANPEVIIWHCCCLFGACFLPLPAPRVTRINVSRRNWVWQRFQFIVLACKNIHIRRYLVVNIVSRGVAELVLFSWTWSGLYYLRKWWASVGFFAPVLRVSSRAARNSFVLVESAGVRLGWPWRCFGSEKLILLTKWLNVRSSLEQFCRTKNPSVSRHWPVRQRLFDLVSEVRRRQIIDPLQSLGLAW